MPDGSSRVFDVAIIGAGAVGCAMARRFARHGARVLLLERGSDILSGASKANSAILHTGFDAPPGSLERLCMQDGYREYLAIRAARNLPLLQTGALVVAWTDDEVSRLDALLRQAHDNGVGDVRRIGRADLLRLEPNLAASAKAALHVPGEHVIDPWSPFLSYVLEAQALGAEIVLNAEVTGGEFDGQTWTLATGQGGFRAATVINCAGLYGDRIEAALLGAATFQIRPRKGQFVVLDKAAARLLTAIILPVPGERTKGVLLARTVFGNVLVGPTAEDQTDRERAAVSGAELRTLLDRAATLLPALRDIPVTAAYAGLRPASEHKHYRVHRLDGKNWITVGGIRSTGMTAALGIARHVWGLYAGDAGAPAETAAPVPMPNLAEHLPRDWQHPGYGEIVCQCELVTSREIEAALSGALPAGDLGGLKRRTRCAMGRCQGFVCAGRLAELTAGRFRESLAQPA